MMHFWVSQLEAELKPVAQRNKLVVTRMLAPRQRPSACASRLWKAG
jgi:hypothetical protein